MPEATPVHEASKLQADRARAGMTPFAWVVNSSLAANSTDDQLLGCRAASELRWIGEVEALSRGRLAILPWVALAPVGRERLAALAGDRAAIL